MTSPSTDQSQPTALRHAVRFVPVLLWMGLIFAFSHRQTLPNPAGFDVSVLGHFTVYAVLAGLTWWALGSFALSTRSRILVAFTIAVLYGVSDEWHQSFVPGRHPDVLDLVTDAIGAAVGIAVAIRIAPLLARLRP